VLQTRRIIFVEIKKRLDFIFLDEISLVFNFFPFVEGSDRLGSFRIDARNFNEVFLLCFENFFRTTAVAHEIFCEHITYVWNESESELMRKNFFRHEFRKIKMY